MTKMTKKRIAKALGCLLIFGAAATLAYFIRSSRSEATDSSSTGVLMMVAVAGLVLVGAFGWTQTTRTRQPKSGGQQGGRRGT
jgi:membrane protein DedA with SNARE-associated domain